MKRLIMLFWALFFLGILYLPSSGLFDTNKKVLNIFTWADLIDPEMVQNFEKDTGIKVKIHHYTSNEELFVKLRSNNGSNYDLITPSDYAIKILKNSNLLQPLDKSRIAAFDQISPYCKGLDYDKNNDYSLPYNIEPYGIAIDKRIFSAKDMPKDLSVLFDTHQMNHKIFFTPDPIEAICFASHYLYGEIDSLSPQQINEVKHLLTQQKKWVEAYVDYRGKYLLSTKNCSVGLMRSSYNWIATKETQSLEFFLMKGAMFATIENFAIPKGTKKADLAYQFINYAYQTDAYKKNTEYNYMYPCIEDMLDILEDLPDSYFTIYHQMIENRPIFFDHVSTEDEMRSLWIATK